MLRFLVCDLSGCPPTSSPAPIKAYNGHPLLPRQPRHGTPALISHNSGWAERNQLLGESRELIFLANNLREAWTQAQILPLRSQQRSEEGSRCVHCPAADAVGMTCSRHQRGSPDTTPQYGRAAPHVRAS